MPGPGATFDRRPVKAVYVEGIADFGKHLQFRFLQAAIGGGNVAGEGIGGLVKFFGQRLGDKTQKSVNPVFFFKQVENRGADGFDPTEFIIGEDRQVVHNALDRDKLGRADVLIRRRFRDHHRDQRVLRGKRGKRGNIGGIDVHPTCLRHSCPRTILTATGRGNRKLPRRKGPADLKESDMSELREAALTSKAWPLEEARRVLKRYKKAPPEKGYVLFETGYGPSGLPHIGTFGEVVRTTMIRRAFELISDIPTRLVCFSDDMDGMRKAPDNVPNREMLLEHLQRPLTAVPDPFGEFESFGHHNNAMLRRFLDTFGFEYTFISATDFYKSGAFDKVLLRAAERYDDIMKVMLKTLREERRQNYSIFLPIHPETGRVLYVPLTHVAAKEGTITFDDEDGREWTLPVTGGRVKLQWKPDFGARWAALGVDFEMYGKDHSTNTPIYDRICRILGRNAPEHFTYELFLDDRGEKISKSKGNGLSIDEWLAYASTESLSCFMYQKPGTAKRMHFDTIPRAMDEYHRQLRAYPGQDAEQKLNNPVHHIHGGEAPESKMVVPFSMLLNLASVSSANDSETLWGFLRRYAPEARAGTHPDLDAAVGYAVRYYNDLVKPAKRYRLPTDPERAAMEDLLASLRAWDGPADAEALQSAVFAAGRGRFDPLRDWFTALYEVLLGASQGPRFGGFIALYGINESIRLIEDALAGRLAE